MNWRLGAGGGNQDWGAMIPADLQAARTGYASISTRESVRGDHTDAACAPGKKQQSSRRAKTVWISEGIGAEDVQKSWTPLTDSAWTRRAT